MHSPFAASLLALGLALAPCSIAFAADSASGIGPSFKGPVGLQLYSLRGEFAADGVPATLKKVADYGLKEVELAGTYNLSPERFTQLLKEHGLKAVSGHFAYDKYKSDPESVAQEAKALGLKYAGCAWINHGPGPFNEANTRDAITVFNKAGEVLAKHGIQFFYHCHGYEFAPHGDGTFMDLLAKETDPKHVAFQMDVFWVVHPGQDPVAWLNKLGSRWQLVHLKDMRKGIQGDLTGKSDVKNDVVLGTGQMNWPAILAAAQKAGVKHYFIEDESPWAASQIAESLKYLEGVKY
ncbi:MAG TPA: sugar phosphate isomerase [Verrucomicrobiales bacterium]|nr:sugar phosphate isomerase [Verrucomicrobiales bacterium]